MELSLIHLELANFTMVGYSSLMFPSVHFASCYVFKESQTSVIHSSNIPDQSCRPSLCQYTMLDLAALPNYISLLIFFLLVDVGCINVPLLTDPFLLTPNHHIGNGSRNPSEYIGSCSH